MQNLADVRIMYLPWSSSEDATMPWSFGAKL